MVTCNTVKSLESYIIQGNNKKLNTVHIFV